MTDELVRRLVVPWDPSQGDAFPVGVGLPAAIRNGVTLTAANIDPAWIGFSAERELGLATHRIVAVGNDADVAGLAEIRFGAGRYQRGLVMVLTIGTGIGSALFIDGRLVPNTELGHLEIKGRDAEERAAESARERFGLGWRDWAAGLDEYLHELERLFWPDLFIFGGGASKRADNYLPYLTVKTPIAIATFRNNAGIVGGALIAHERRARAAASAVGRAASPELGRRRLLPLAECVQRRRRAYLAARLERLLDVARGPSGSGSGRTRTRSRPACPGRSRRSGRA